MIYADNRDRKRTKTDRQTDIQSERNTAKNNNNSNSSLVVARVIVDVHSMFWVGFFPRIDQSWFMVLNIYVEFPLLLSYLLRWTKVTDNFFSPHFDKTLFTCEKMYWELFFCGWDTQLKGLDWFMNELTWNRIVGKKNVKKKQTLTK